MQEPERLLLVDLLQGLERALLRVLGQGLACLLVRGPERWLLRDEDRVLFRAQMQHPEQALLRCKERRLGRGLDMGLVQGLLQWLVRPLLQTLLQRLEQALGQGLVWGLGLPQGSRGRENQIADEVRSQKLDARSQNSRDGSGRREEGIEGVSARRIGGYGGTTKSQ